MNEQFISLRCILTSSLKDRETLTPNNSREEVGGPEREGESVDAEMMLLLCG